mgnify:CR=1 FL=1
MQSQFSTLSKTGKRIFKKPQLIFHHQDPECTFINKRFRDFSAFYQFFQTQHISRTHHINVYTGFGSLNCCFFHISCHSLFFQLTYGAPI